MISIYLIVIMWGLVYKLYYKIRFLVFKCVQDFLRLTVACLRTSYRTRFEHLELCHPIMTCVQSRNKGCVTYITTYWILVSVTPNIDPSPR